MTGPVGSGNENIPVFDGTSGKVLKDSLKKLADFVLSVDLVAYLADKVDKVPGKGLSTNDFTSALLSKLNALSSGGYRGTFDNEIALTTALPGPNTPGDYAYVVPLIPAPGSEEVEYIWDAINSVWTKTAPGSTPSTGAEIAAVLFAEPDVNNLSDILLAKLNQAVTQAYVDSVISTLSGAASPNNNIIPESTTARVLSVNDTFKYIRLTSVGACTLTLPNDATATWTLTPFIGFRITTVAPTLSLGAGVVVNGIGNLAGLSADDNFALKKVGVDAWDLVVGGCW